MRRYLTGLATRLATVARVARWASRRQASENPAGAGLSVGEPGRIRTSNQLIKSQMLCR